jgi:hypothetical protein
MRNTPSESLAISRSGEPSFQMRQRLERRQGAGGFQAVTPTDRRAFVADQDNTRNPQQQQNDPQRNAPDQQNQQGGQNQQGQQGQQGQRIDTDNDGITRDANDKSPNDRGEAVE